MSDFSSYNIFRFKKFSKETKNLMQIIDSTPAALSADLQMYLRNGDVFFRY